MDKLGKMRTKGWVLVLIVSVIAVYFVYWLGSHNPVVTPTGVQVTQNPSPQIIVNTPTPTGGAVSTSTCSISPNFLETAVNKYSGASLTSSMWGYQLNGNLLTPQKGDANIQVSPGNKIDAIVNASGYCGKLLSSTTNDGAWKDPQTGQQAPAGTIVCSPTIKPVVQLIQEISDGSTAQSSQNYVLDPSQQLNSQTANYSVSNTQRNIPFTWVYDAPSNRGLCDAGDHILTCLVNKTEITGLTVTASRNGHTVALTPTGTPASVSIGSTQNAYSWDIGKDDTGAQVVLANSGNPITIRAYFTTTTDTTVSVADGTQAGTTGQQINQLPFCAINDQDLYQDQSISVGAVKVGATNEKLADLGATLNVVNATFWMR